MIFLVATTSSFCGRPPEHHGENAQAVDAKARLPCPSLPTRSDIRPGSRGRRLGRSKLVEAHRHVTAILDDASVLDQQVEDPSTSDSVRNAWVIATRPHCRVAISCALSAPSASSS